MATTYLSEHFTLEEMTVTKYKQYNNIPLDTARGNLEQLCKQVLEPIRAALGNKPLYVSSGFRSKYINQLVGGAPNSYHMQGLAADLPFSNARAAITAASTILSLNLPLAELILCRRGDSQWVHVALALPGVNKRYVGLKQYG